MIEHFYITRKFVIVQTRQHQKVVVNRTCSSVTQELITNRTVNVLTSLLYHELNLDHITAVSMNVSSVAILHLLLNCSPVERKT